jgi:hypothetical protein
MNNYFFKNFKTFAKSKSAFKMMSTNINSHVFKINFANKTYYDKVMQLVNCTNLIKSYSNCQIIGMNSGISIEDILNNLKLQKILGAGKTF